MHQSLIFAMMEPKFAIPTNKNIQEGKAVLICWMKLHHQLLFEPGRTPALVLLSGHPPLLGKDAHSAEVWATSTPWWAAAPTHPAAGCSFPRAKLLISPGRSFLSKPAMRSFPLSVLDRKISQWPWHFKRASRTPCVFTVGWNEMIPDRNDFWSTEAVARRQISSVKAGLGCVRVEAGVSARQVSIWNSPC